MSKKSNRSMISYLNNRNHRNVNILSGQHLNNQKFDVASEEDFPTLDPTTSRSNILAVVTSHEVNRMFHASRPTPPYVEYSTYALTKLDTSRVDLDKGTKDILEEEKSKIKNRFGLDSVSEPTTYPEMHPKHSALEWHTQSEQDGFDSPRIVFNIKYQSLKKQIVDEMHTFYKTINTIADIVSKLYEKFLFENKDKKEFEEYFKIKNGSLKIQIPFYEDLQSEREVIGENIDWNNYNHIEQLKKQDLHSKLFDFCKKYGIGEETFLKCYQFKMDRNNYTHNNFPSIQNQQHLRKRMETIQKSNFKIGEEVESKFHISQTDFNQLIEALKKQID